MYLSSIIPNQELLINSLLPLVKGALLYTIPLAVITFILGLILALLTAVARIAEIRPLEWINRILPVPAFLQPLFRIKLLEWIARVYVSIIRGTPLLVQLFIIFYGLPSVGITLDTFPAAIIGFSLNVGAYSSEIIRAAILAVPKGQWEAGYSIGMSYTTILRRIIFPQAMRISVPPLSNSFIGLIKDTSLASVILVTEMFRKAQEIAASSYTVLPIYIEAALIYWVICFVLSIIQGRMEERLNRYHAR